MSLTETNIKAIRVPEREQWVNDGTGLYLRVLPSGRKSWGWRAKKNGKTSYTTLGKLPTLNVKQARTALAHRSGRSVPTTVEYFAERGALDVGLIRLRVMKSGAPGIMKNPVAADQQLHTGLRQVTEMT